MADPLGGEVFCHNDVCPESVVFRDGVAVALLDFDVGEAGVAVSTSGGGGEHLPGQLAADR